MPDPFAVFDLPPRFDVDSDELRRRYLEASAASHPDRFTDPLDQADAEERIAEVNHAYRTLADPESRAHALLHLLGVSDGGTDEKASLPPALLMELLEVREALEEAIAENNADAVKRYRADAEAQRQEHLDRLAMLFDADPVDTKAVRQELNLLRYAQRMLEQTHD